MVVDTSILLAVFFNEEHGPWAADQLERNRGALLMSTVNYTEVLILIENRQPNLIAELRRRIEDSSIRLIPPHAGHAEIAAGARLRYPLNLGDCFAYALAKDEDVSVLTLDGDFRKTDVEVVFP